MQTAIKSRHQHGAYRNTWGKYEKMREKSVEKLRQLRFCCPLKAVKF